MPLAAVPIAVWAASAAGAGASVAGAAMQAHAAGKASDAQQKSQENALTLQKQVYQDQLQRTQPYVNAGTTALGGLMGNFSPNNFNQRVTAAQTPYQGAVGMMPSSQQYAAPPQGAGGQLRPGQMPSMSAPSGPAQMVWMRAPTGEVQQVPASLVAQAQAKGAERLEGMGLGSLGMGGAASSYGRGGN